MSATAAELLQQARAAGLELLLRGEQIIVRGPTKLRARWAPLLREHRDELLRLLAQWSQADDEPRHAEGSSAAPEPAAEAGDPGAPCCGNAWRKADAAYQSHLWGCPTCSSAGRGYGSRCPEGARLWAAYTNQPRPASHRPERQPQAAPEPLRHPFERERQNGWPASEPELARMAAVHARAVAFGLDAQQADHAADVVHWSYRLGDLRPCLACAHLRAGTASRWHCAAQKLPLAERFVLQPHRCPQFRELEAGSGWKV